MIALLAVIWFVTCVWLATRLVGTNPIEAQLLTDPKARETCRLLKGSANPITFVAWVGLMFVVPPVGAAIMFDQTRGGGAKVRAAALGPGRSGPSRAASVARGGQGGA